MHYNLLLAIFMLVTYQGFQTGIKLLFVETLLKSSAKIQNQEDIVKKYQVSVEVV